MTTDLIYDWNKESLQDAAFDFQSTAMKKQIELNDETLRDGLQATYVVHPSLHEKMQLLTLMEKLKIDLVNLGFPVAGETQKKDVIALAKYARDNRFSIRLECGGRIVRGDVEEIISVSQEVGVAITAGLFVASSQLRYLVEQWDREEIAKSIHESISLAVQYNLPVMFVTEDTTRARPDHIENLYRHAIESGATRICVCDTVGFATPWGVTKLIHFVREHILKDNPSVKLDWHGHNDRGFATVNALAAILAGADEVQAAALGVGERAGNTSMEEIIVNLQMEGLIQKDLAVLTEYAKEAERILGFRIRSNDPIIGSDVFKTATGVHAAAIVKARTLHHPSAELVYSSIDPRPLGKEHEILIGPMSGKSNVEWVLDKLKISFDPPLVQKILEKAKQGRRILTEEDIKMIV
jgi:2-isopropylmalate synthase